MKAALPLFVLAASPAAQAQTVPATGATPASLIPLHYRQLPKAAPPAT